MERPPIDEKVKEYPAAVIATSIEAGEIYAELLQIPNYKVFTKDDLDKVQGLRLRAVVITPGYLYEMDTIRYDRLTIYNAAMHGMSFSHWEVG